MQSCFLLFLQFFFFSKTYTYLINKLERIKFITELDSERPFHGHQVKAKYRVKICAPFQSTAEACTCDRFLFV